MAAAPVRRPARLLSSNQDTPMPRLAGPLLACALALANAPANAQAGATPATPDNGESAHSSTTSEPNGAATQKPTADDVCRALEQSAAENALPVEFFARVIWQESRFDAMAVSPKGAAGMAQFMPATASWHGLADPFEPVEALRHSAAYLRELLDRFGNLGLAAPAYNAWLTNHRALPTETRNYVALVTGWTAASSSPPEKADTTIPQGMPCTRLANLMLAPKQERQRIAAYMLRRGIHARHNQRQRMTAASIPRSWAAINAMRPPGAMPAKVSERERAIVTAGFANDVDAVNQYAEVM